ACEPASVRVAVRARGGCDGEWREKYLGRRVDPQEPGHRGRHSGNPARFDQLDPSRLTTVNDRIMKIYDTIDSMRAASRAQRKAGKTLGLVPTMGALHEGHLSLMRQARAQCDLVAVSLFVNPLQFGPSEDLAKYPRDFARDRGLMEKEGVDFLFAPGVEEMY